eukprot:4191321-Alexandrium_andersonii.AAC.1
MKRLVLEWMVYRRFHRWHSSGGAHRLSWSCHPEALQCFPRQERASDQCGVAVANDGSPPS